MHGHAVASITKLEGTKRDGLVVVIIHGSGSPGSTTSSAIFLLKFPNHTLHGACLGSVRQSFVSCLISGLALRAKGFTPDVGTR